jgi:hypothetical protein
MFRLRYIVWFLTVMGLLVLLIVLLNGGSAKKTTVPKPLYTYASTNAEASLTIDGPVNADQDHQAVKVIVGQYNVTYELISGYNGQVVKVQTYPNTEAAYNVFLRALATAGFTEGSNDQALSDERGYCPLGDRYILQLANGDDQIERYWTSTCGSPRTYSGNISLTLQLFEAQVPNFSSPV